MGCGGGGGGGSGGGGGGGAVDECVDVVAGTDCSLAKPCNAIIILSMFADVDERGVHICWDERSSTSAWEPRK